MKKKALFVGINYPGSKHALRGCVNDAVNMNQVLTQHFGFTENKNKRMLTDHSATTANIMERLEWLVSDAEAGDVLFFHYSGHGSQVIDSPQDLDDNEPDGLDEIICPIDLDWRNKIIKDDDLKRVFDKVPAGVNLTVVLDCCHSGGGIDSWEEYKPMEGVAADFDPMQPNRNRLLPMPADIANRGFGLDLKTRDRSIQSPVKKDTGLLISGCQSQQTSADAFIHNKFQGAATWFLMHVLAKYNYDVDYKTLVDEMNHLLAKYGYTQRPELNGPSDQYLNKFLEPLVK